MPRRFVRRDNYAIRRRAELAARRAEAKAAAAPVPPPAPPVRQRPHQWPPEIDAARAMLKTMRGAKPPPRAHGQWTHEQDLAMMEMIVSGVTFRDASRLMASLRIVGPDSLRERYRRLLALYG
jgi:hypothetical protein